eukprot:scaffold183366_cov17-Tisochrysis_lutea.AAC.1
MLLQEVSSARSLVMLGAQDEVSSVGSLTVLDAHDADAFDEDGEAGEVESAAASRPPTNSARQRPGHVCSLANGAERSREILDDLSVCCLLCSAA